MKKVFKKLLAGILAAALTVAMPVGNLGEMATVNAEDDIITLPINDQFLGGSIPETGTTRFYSVTLTQPGWLKVVFQAQGAMDGVNTFNSYFEIKNYDQTESYGWKGVSGADSSPGTDSMELALESGQYVIVVGERWNSNGKYRIKASFTAANNNETEPNNAFDNAMPIAENAAVTGFMSAQDQIDFYKFTAPRDMTVRVTCITMTQDLNFSTWDSDFQSSGSFRFWNASASDPKTAYIDVNMKAGVNYIRISPYNNQTGKYTIKWQAAPKPVTGVFVTSTVSSVEIGNTLQLTATILPSDATDKRLSWTSDNQSVAIVNENGLVTGLSEGTATIKASAIDGSNNFGTIQIKVTAPPRVNTDSTTSNTNENGVGSGNNNGTAVETPSTVVKQINDLSVKASGKKKLTIKWKKQPNAKKYEIQVSSDRDFSKNKNKMVKIVKGSKTKITVKYKKTGRVYIRVRALDSNGYVGKWSKVKKTKVK